LPSPSSDQPYSVHSFLSILLVATPGRQKSSLKPLVFKHVTRRPVTGLSRLSPGRRWPRGIGEDGFNRRVTTFTVPEQEEECSFSCFLVNVNVPVAHYSSKQGGLNLDGGVTWKAFGEDSSGRLFAEARYVRVNSPKSNVFGRPDGIQYIALAGGPLGVSQQVEHGPPTEGQPKDAPVERTTPAGVSHLVVLKLDGKASLSPSK
jgi:hypothetical protein